MIELINHAIKLVKKNVNLAELYGMSPYMLKRHLKTIQLNPGRGQGKTHSMMTLAREGDLIIVHSEDTVRTLRHTYPDCLARILTAQRFLRNFCNGRVCYCINKVEEYNYVWVDEPTLIKRTLSFNPDYDFEIIFKVTEAAVYILLGE